MATIRQILNSFKVSKEDKKNYKKILRGNSANKEEKVIKHFMRKYVYPLNTVFSKSIKSVLTDLISVDTTRSEFAKGAIGFKATNKHYKEVLQKNYKEVSDLVTGSLYKKNKIKSKALQKQIADEVLGEFEGFIKGAMSNTEKEILNDIRKIQREVIQHTLKLKKLQNIPNFNDYVKQEKKRFKEKLLKKYPGIRKKILDGKILKSKPWKDKFGNTRHLTYTLDRYTDFAIEATLLNAETTSGIMEVEQSGDRVVEYYLANNRKLKTKPFPYCQTVLRKKIKGKSLLAVDEGAAEILGIDSIATALENGAMDRRRKCRHAIRRIEDQRYMQTINKLLYAGDLSFEVKEG